MSLKRYVASCSEYSTFLTLEDGREIKLYFSGKDVTTKKRFIDVTDPLIQKALEKSSKFGIYFTKSNEFNWTGEDAQVNKKASVAPTEMSIEEIKKGNTPLKDENAFPEITKVGEARAFLIEKYNKKIANRKEAFKVADELGISFPNLPKE